MNQFQPSTPRAALAASAVALTALVLGLSIVLPASLETDAEGLRAAAAARVILPVVQLEPLVVTEQFALDGAEDAVVMRETSSDAALRATRVAATSNAQPSGPVQAHCPHAKATQAKAASSHAI